LKCADIAAMLDEATQELALKTEGK
jgi:hypothetical protein